MRRMIEELLFRLLRTRLGSALAATWFNRFSFAMPFTKLRETPELLAFEHPVPSHPLHVLIVPKRGFASMPEAAGQAPAIFSEAFALASELVEEMGLEAGGYRVIVTGGAYQDVRLLHFHLISDDPPGGRSGG